MIHRSQEPRRSIHTSHTVRSHRHTGTAVSSQKADRTSSRLWISSILVAVALLGLARFGLRPMQSWMATRCLGEIAVATPDRVDTLIHRLTQLGEPGLIALVEALGSPQERIARSAYHELQTLLIQWEQMDARLAAPNLAVVAGALADRVKRFGPAARLDAADLVTRMLQRPLTTQSSGRSELVDDCDTVLEIVRLNRLTTSPSHPRSQPATSTEQAVPDRVGQNTDSPVLSIETGPSLSELTQLPGGNLVPVMPDDLHRQADGDAMATTTDSAAQSNLAPQYQPKTPAPRLLAQPNLPLKAIATPVAPKNTTTNSADRMVPHTEASSPKAVLTRPISDPILELLRQSLSTNQPVAAAAKETLNRMGFGEVHYQLAARLFHPDPTVRTSLVRLLPGIKTIDAQQWLLWLADDPDVEVRLTVISLMATTNHPQLLEKLEAIARRDKNARVRSQADIIARRRMETSIR